MTTPYFEIKEPQKRTSAVVFASPHSGRIYPEAFLRESILDPISIRMSEDAFVDNLFSTAPDHGVPFLVANAPRAYVDLNRDADELDSAVIDGVPSGSINPRVASGLGVIPRVVAQGRPIYSGKMARYVAQQRISEVWGPYHNALRGLMRRAYADFGCAILVDLHSMPPEALDGTVKKGSQRPDIVIGDRFGRTAAPDLVEQVSQAFRDEGFVVARNAPFAGAYIVQKYGRPSRGHHAIQVEIDRSLYMNSSTISPNENYVAFKQAMGRVSVRIADLGRNRTSMAAE